MKYAWKFLICWGSTSVVSCVVQRWMFPGLFVLIEFTGVTLVHKSMQVLSTQLSETSPAHHIMYLSPKAGSFPSPFSPALARLHLMLPPAPLADTALASVSACYICSCVLFFHFNLSPSIQPRPCPSPSDSCQSGLCIHASKRKRAFDCAYLFSTTVGY